MGLPLIVYLPPYYASDLGLPVATVGLVFFLVRAADVCLDPFIGQAMDATRTPVGRFRPWLVAGSLLLALGSWGLFMAEPGVSAGATAAWLFTLYIGFSMVYLAHTAWGATLSDDYAERARVFGWWQAANVLGLILVLLLPPLAGRLFPGEGAAPGIHAMGWFIIATLPLAALAISAGVPERPAPADATHRIRVADLVDSCRQPLMARLLVADLLLCMAPGITGALFQFFFVAARGYTPAEASTLLLIYFVAGLAAAPLWIRAAARFGKHRATAAAALWLAVTQAALPLLPAGDVWLAAPAMAISGVPYAAAPFLLRAILADVCDAERLRTGQDRTGLLFAVLTATQKIAYGIPVGVLYPLLGAIGFEAAKGAGNSASALLGLELLFTVPVVLIALGGAWTMWRWRLDAAAHAEVVAALGASVGDARAQPAR